MAGKALTHTPTPQLHQPASASLQVSEVSKPQVGRYQRGLTRGLRLKPTVTQALPGGQELSALRQNVPYQGTPALLSRGEQLQGSSYPAYRLLGFFNMLRMILLPNSQS